MRVLILSCVCLCASVLAPQSNFAQQIPATDDGNDNYRRVIPGDNVFHLPEEGSMIVIAEETKFFVKPNATSESIRTFAPRERLWVRKREKARGFLIAYDSKSDRTGWIREDPDQVSYQIVENTLVGEKKAAQEFFGKNYFKFDDLRQNREFEEAIKLGERINQNVKLAFGADHPLYAHRLEELAEIYQEQKKWDQAIECYLMSKAIWKKIVSINHYDYQRCLRKLAIMYQESGNFEEAMRLMGERMILVQSQRGSNSASYALCLLDIAYLLAESSRPKRAMSAFERALAAFESVGFENLGRLDQLQFSDCKQILTKNSEIKSHTEFTEFLLKFEDGGIYNATSLEQ